VNVLGISGSPRARSNSHLLLEHALEPFSEAGWEVRVLRLRDLTVRPCLACDHCRTHPGTCAQRDDMDGFYDAFRWCDALLVASPVYSRNVCAQLMCVLDRHYAVNVERPLAGKPGGAIAVGAGEGGGQAITVTAIYTWLLSCGAVAVPGELNGLTARASAEGEVLGQEKRLRQARVLGENVLALAAQLPANKRINLTRRSVHDDP
jgi:multimeric flavodoxin WrbA